MQSFVCYKLIIFLPVNFGHMYGSSELGLQVKNLLNSLTFDFFTFFNVDLKFQEADRAIFRMMKCVTSNILLA